jgi:hypothetical protein
MMPATVILGRSGLLIVRRIILRRRQGPGNRHEAGRGKYEQRLFEHDGISFSNSKRSVYLYERDYALRVARKTNIQPIFA